MIHRSHGIRFFPEADGGDGTDDGTGTDDGDKDDGTPQIDPEEHEKLLAEVKDLRDAENKRRTEAARAAKAAKDAERRKAEESGDSDKLKAELKLASDALAKAELRANQAQARAIAAELGAVDPGTVVRLLDFEDMADPSDDREVKRALEALIDEKPFLKGQVKPKHDAGAGAGQGSKGPSMNDVIRRAAGYE